MKNLTNKTKVALTVLCCLGLTLFMNSCIDDDTPANCGCESETLTTIPESANLIGRLAFKSNNSIDPYYKNHYWITYIEQNCSNCIHHMIICNDEILGVEFEEITSLSQGEFIEVKFSGNLKEICERRYDLADITYERITLTSIEQQ